MIIQIKQEKNNEILIYNGQQLMERFIIKDDLSKSLNFLEKINTIKTISGTPIYETSMIGDFFVWPTYQHILFRSFLQNYVRYEAIIKYLYQRNIKNIIVRDINNDLRSCIIFSNIRIINSFSFKRFFKNCGSFILKLLAWIISILAIIKSVFFPNSIFVYTPDKFSKKYGCDFRFQNVYKYLKENNISKIEIFHTIFGKEFISNIIKRKRLAIYTEAFPLFFIKRDKMIREYDLSMFEDHQGGYLRNLLSYVDQELFRRISRIRKISKLLRFSKNKILLAIDDMRYIGEIVAACDINNIEMHVFQHGQFNKYQAGWMNYKIPLRASFVFDNFYIWNDYWKKVLLKYSSQFNENNVKISGLLRELAPISFLKESHTQLNILVPYEALAPKNEVSYYLEKLLDNGVKLFFKPRPDLLIEKQLEEYNILKRKNVEIIEEMNRNAFSQ
jgi:hypothetical protein